MSTKDSLKELLPFCNLQICKQKNQEFLIKITERMRNTVNAHSFARWLSDDSSLESETSVAVPSDAAGCIFILPNKGTKPQNFVEYNNDKIFIPTFNLAFSFSWDIKHIRSGRMDIVDRDIRIASRTLIDYEEESLFRVMSPAVTCNVPGYGDKSPSPAPIVKLDKSDVGYGFCSKELIKEMFICMYNKGHIMTHVILSPEDLADFREWTENQVDDNTRREIFIGSGRDTFEIEHEEKAYNIELKSNMCLGMTGKYNINSSDSKSGILKVGSKTKQFNDYSPENLNKVGEDGSVIDPGETQIYGISKVPGNKGFIMIKDDLVLWDDHKLLAESQHGYYGWEEVGFCVANPSSMCMGVIDRAL